MQFITRNIKIYFVAVGLLALWVGVWGYFIPTKVDQAIPWLVPPLHARFLGAMYLSGTAFMIAGIFSGKYFEVKIMVPMIAIWTGMLFIVSLFYLGEFDYSRTQVWIWFAAYFIYPAIAIWLAWTHRNLNEKGIGSSIPTWMKTYLLIQGILVTLLALALLFFSTIMVNNWPWKITPLLAQIYSAPFLSYGIGSLLISRLERWDEVRVVLIGTLVFALGVFIASLIHRDLFSFANISAWVWFGGFFIASLMLGWMTQLSLKDRGAKSS
ncbi:MAG: hypothetical protein JNK81_02945 [Anaerolineales bacterium]|nr:hypothetical protein [Anaerolineales bacterium]